MQFCIQQRLLIYLHATCHIYALLLAADQTIEQQVRPSLGTDVCPHMLIHVHTPCKLDRHASHKSLEAPYYNKGALAVQNLMPLALSSADKSVTVQTHTISNKQ